MEVSRTHAHQVLSRAAVLATEAFELAAREGGGGRVAIVVVWDWGSEHVERKERRDGSGDAHVWRRVVR